MDRWAYRIVPVDHRYYIQTSYVHFGGEYFWDYYKDFSRGYASRLYFNNLFAAEKWIKDRLELDRAADERREQTKKWEAENAHIKEKIYR